MPRLEAWCESANVPSLHPPKLTQRRSSSSTIAGGYASCQVSSTPDRISYGSPKC